MEVCREFLRNCCKRPESDCRFAHPPKHILASQLVYVDSCFKPDRIEPSQSNGGHYYVTVCMDYMNGRCARASLKCR